jgi:RNA polymerase sigma-70 factor (ECF subfamily)
LTAGEQSDETLLARIVRRDEAALAVLYDRYRVLAYSIALRITGDHAVAEEVLQDMFLAVWRTAGGFQVGGSVAAWLVGIARHRAIDATRAAPFRARNREQGLEPALELPTDELTEEQVARSLVGEHVRSALGQLAPAQREALELAYYAGLSQAEIAARIGAPLGTVKTRMRLGLTHLRRVLGETEAPGPWPPG